MRNITKKNTWQNLESLLNGCFDSLLLFSKSCSSPSHLLHHFTTNIVLRKWFFSFGFFCSFIFANFWIITEECMFCLKFCLTLYIHLNLTLMYKYFGQHFLVVTLFPYLIITFWIQENNLNLIFIIIRYLKFYKLKLCNIDVGRVVHQLKTLIK